MPSFVPAAELCRAFYVEALAPALTEIPHSAGLFGPGSDVLGYDTARSTDHNWGPRATILVDPPLVTTARALIDAALPDEFRGWPVRAGQRDRPAEYWIEVTYWPDWLTGQLGTAGPELKPADWLVIPQQHLLGIVAGTVFADPAGVLAAAQRRLTWYPDDVWWWLLACQWRRLGQEEAFVQRTAEVGDELGSAIVTARLARDAIRLALLIARRYAPYSKWLGTAFARLPHPDGLDRQLAAAVQASDLAGRERALCQAYESLAHRYLALPGAGRLDPTVRPYFDRPALVLGADRFVADSLAQVADQRLRELPLTGSIDQFADNTDLLTSIDLVQRLRPLYPA